MTPASPLVSPAEQTITIAGRNFQPGLTVTATLPNGDTERWSGQRISNVTATSLRATAVLDEPRRWSIEVSNPDRQAAQTVDFQVAANELRLIWPTAKEHQGVGYDA